MKFKVEQKSDATHWYFEIADHVLLQGLQPGKTFAATKLSSDLTPLEDVNVHLHHDGRAIIVGNTVVPFSGAGVLLKGADARIKMGAPATFRRLSIEQIKPISVKKSSSSLGGGNLKSPLTGKVLTVLVTEGQVVNEGEILMTIEAMKMENRIQAECSGVVQNIKVIAGNNVSVDEVVLTLAPLPDGNNK